jgi:hypothetical protein
MVTEVFCFTAAGQAARDHYERTIERLVPVEEIAKYEPRIAAELTASGRDEVRCWGSIPGPGNRRNWERMRPGHWAIVYVGDGRFPLLLRLMHKARSRALAEHLWDRDGDDRTWELMFFFGATKEVDLSIDDVRGALGYEDDWWPQGLLYPTPEHQEALLEKFGSAAAFASSAGGVAGVDDLGKPPEPDELLLGGPFKGAPTKPPKVPDRHRPQDPDVAGRGYLAHERTVELLCEHIGPSFRKGTPGVNHDGAWIVDERFCLSEVKSINSGNEVGQLQKGFGQILHNRFKAEQHGVEGVSVYLVAEREPTNSKLWAELCARHDVVFTWPERFEADIPKPR